MRSLRPLRGVAVAVVAALGLSACSSIYDVNLPGGAQVGSNPMTVHVKFRDVLDLVPQSTVKVNDVTVGRVTKVALKGYTADVTLVLPRDLRLPANSTAEIRQTSLLGEKFVSLSPPAADASPERLGNGDVIGLSRTGRNPEVEEVLGALSLLLNGGGVGQLKIIASELNTAFGGRESEVRSVVEQLKVFTGQLDANKTQIISSIDSLNRLAIQLKQQDGSIKLALDELPAAIKSINGQRADLVKTLQALQNLSGIGVKVIQASKAGTIASLRDLAPVLNRLAAAGSALPKSLQVFLTYPFVDAAVGNDPQVARNLHIGDFVNLDARLDINLTNLPALPSVSGLPSQVCDALSTLTARAQEAADQVVDPLPLTSKQKTALKKKIVAALVKQFNKQCKAPDVAALADAAAALLPALLEVLGLPTNIPLPTPSLSLPGVGGLNLPRAGTGFSSARPTGPAGDVFNGPAGTTADLGYNSTLGALLLQGVSAR